MTNTPEPTPGEVAQERHHLYNLAYRLLGSTRGADEIVRQTYARWYALSSEEQEAAGVPRGWLATTAGRLCLLALASSQPIRDAYPGEWLPEPFSDARAVEDRLSLDESVTMSLLVSLELLDPAERVAFVLHDVFGFPFTAVGDVVGRTEASARELARNARRRVHDQGTQKGSPEEHADIVSTLRLLAEAGKPQSLSSLMAPDVVMITDGGGKVPADARTITGAGPVSEKICEVLARDPTVLTEQEVNGRRGLVLRRSGMVFGVVSVNIRSGLITDLWIVLNPDKLAQWN